MVVSLLSEYIASFIQNWHYLNSVNPQRLRMAIEKLFFNSVFMHTRYVILMVLC